MDNKDKKVCVLVVEDDLASRLLITESLLNNQFDVIEADNGQQAYDMFVESKPDIVLSDVMMPIMDGFCLCEKIRATKQGKYIPVIMMTGLDDFASIHKAYDVGATDFIMKPVNYLLLQYRLSYLLRAKDIDDALVKSRNRLAMAQKISKLCNWELDIETGLFTYSSELKNIFALSNEVKLDSIDDFIQLFSKEIGDELKTVIQDSIQNKKRFEINHRCKLQCGKTITIEQIGEYWLDEVTQKPSLLVTLQDVSERSRAESTIKHLALHEKLTGLPNRAFLNKSIIKLLNQAAIQSRKLIIMQLNIDNFARINNSLGHTIGDNLLRAITTRLKETLRSPEVLAQVEDLTQSSYESLCHLGGDDFVIVFNNIARVENTANIARHILKEIEAPFVIDKQEFRITSSIGISVFPDDAEDGETLLANTSAALQKAKENGRNTYKFFQQFMNARAFEKLSLEMGLRRALEEEQFELYFQPKLDVKAYEVKSVEVLLRWRHPELGLVSPANFIPIAESSGLIIPISEWIVRQVCSLKQRWDMNKVGIDELSINLSPSHLREEGLVGLISRSLELFELPKNVIDLEITESVIMNDIDVVIPVLEQMRSIGCSISIDDFGTGYSSLSYLNKLPIENLKIDQSFIHDLMDNEDGCTIVNAIISLAHNLGLKVIAEGVEEKQQFDFLAQHGCEYIQGYYLSRPLPEDEFITWLHDWNQENHIMPEEKVVSINR